MVSGTSQTRSYEKTMHWLCRSNKQPQSITVSPFQIAFVLNDYSINIPAQHFTPLVTF